MAQSRPAPGEFRRGCSWHETPKAPHGHESTLTFETTATPLSAGIIYNSPDPAAAAFATRAPAIQRLGDAPGTVSYSPRWFSMVDQPSRLHQQPQHTLDALEFLVRVRPRIERRARLVRPVFRRVVLFRLRKPSYLISCSHWSPSGACCTSCVSCGRIHSGRAARAAVRAISYAGDDDVAA